MTETILHFILQRLDQIECPVFLHRELERFPEEELHALHAVGILRETSRATEIPRPRNLPPGGDLIVRQTSKGMFGVADEDDYFDPIPLTEDDVRQYDISLPKLAAAIRRDNGISGSGLENHDGLIPLGQKSVEGIGSLNVYFSILNADQKDFLSRCQRLERSPQSQRIVMLTPRGVALSPEGRRILDASGIILAALDSAFDQGSFSIDWIGILGVVESLLAEDHPKDRRVFQKQGKTWLAVYDGVPKSIGDSVGMTYICQLLQSGGQDIHAATLRGAGIGKDNTIVLGSAGEVIDDRARREYRERITEIDEELSEAEANNDLARKEKLNEEREVLNEEIARSTGLHGKNREASSDRERARQSVSAAIHRALKAIKKEHEPLWQHLKNALKIGEFLSYQPDQPTSWTT